MSQPITSFSGDYRFLSNFFPAEITYEGIKYKTTEHAYQAAKTLVQSLRERVALLYSAAEAKKFGRGIHLREDWETVKFTVMLDVLRLKFSDVALATRLLETGDSELIEGNTWGDQIWGVCNGVGENNLGKLLMQVRGEIRAKLTPSVKSLLVDFGPELTDAVSYSCSERSRQNDLDIFESVSYSCSFRSSKSFFDETENGHPRRKRAKPEGGYKVVLADPNWKYNHAGGRGAAENHYRTSPIDEISSLPVSQIVAKDAVLFLWTTWPIYIENPEQVQRVIRSWGFTPKTLGFLWVKTNKKAGTPFWGGGSWTRANSEFCILAVRGDVRAISHGVHQLIETWDENDHVLRAPHPGNKEHSAKPACVRDRIVELIGDVPRIELYSRDRVQGWDAWGDDPALGGSDVDLVQ